MDGADAVVHLVAILDGVGRRVRDNNAQGPRNVVEAAQGEWRSRILHMSALGVTAEHAPLTRYWGSKWVAARGRRERPEWTVFEPSFVFRAGGGALPSSSG